MLSRYISQKIFNINKCILTDFFFQNQRLSYIKHLPYNDNELLFRFHIKIYQKKKWPKLNKKIRISEYFAIILSMCNLTISLSVFITWFFFLYVFFIFLWTSRLEVEIKYMFARHIDLFSFTWCLKAVVGVVWVVSCFPLIFFICYYW